MKVKIWVVLVEWRGVVDTEASRPFLSEAAARSWYDGININPDEDSKHLESHEVEAGDSWNVQSTLCLCTSDGRHLCALCGQQVGAGQKIEPDADGQIRPCGARLYGCAVCGEMYADSAEARECCTEQEGGRR